MGSNLFPLGSSQNINVLRQNRGGYFSDHILENNSVKTVLLQKMEAPSTNDSGLNVVPDVTYGFIGIGNMGFGMAQNIRAKVPKASKLVICDTNKARVYEFFATVKWNLEAAASPREVAEKAVRCLVLRSQLLATTENTR